MKKIISLICVFVTVTIGIVAVIFSFVKINHSPVFADPSYVSVFKIGDTVNFDTYYSSDEELDIIVNKIRQSFVASVLKNAFDGTVFSKTKIEDEYLTYGMNYHINMNSSKIFVQLNYTGLQNVIINGSNYIRQDYNSALQYNQLVLEVSNIDSLSLMKIYVKDYSQTNISEFRYYAIANQGDLYEYLSDLS